MSKLEGRVAIVTGASSGVGWQTAVRLADEGVRLCITARRKEALDRLARELEQKGAECIVVRGDVTRDEDVQRVVSECMRHYGSVDILVNNAGVQIYAPFELLAWSEIQRVFDVTFFGYLRFARAVLPHFRRQGSGHIINVLSMLSKGAAPLLSAYSAAKHALLGWEESLRLELRGSGIEVSGVLVPSVATPMFDHAPTKLGFAPKPVPPTYDPDVAARAIVRCARSPRRESVPVFLQGSLVLWLNHWIPRLGELLLGRWGTSMQMQRDLPIDRPAGNLFRPMTEGVGPRGSIQPTAQWKRLGLSAGILGIAGVALFALGFGGLRIASALRR